MCFSVKPETHRKPKHQTSKYIWTQLMWVRCLCFCRRLRHMFTDVAQCKHKSVRDQPPYSNWGVIWNAFRCQNSEFEYLCFFFFIKETFFSLKCILLVFFKSIVRVDFQFTTMVINDILFWMCIIKWFCVTVDNRVMVVKNLKVILIVRGTSRKVYINNIWNAYCSIF